MPSKSGAATTALEELPSFRTNGLTPVQWRFVHEYLIDCNATQAYLRASPKVDYETANAQGPRLLRLPHVAQEVQRLMDERAAITGITADRVLLNLYERAMADVGDLVEHRIGSCRHCWGAYFQFQSTDAELELASDKHIREQAKNAKEAAAKGKPYEFAPFHERGGGGYDPNKPPNPECPECWGDGKARIIMKDLRSAPPGARAIYAGMKVTKEGTQVLIDDRVNYFRMIGQHLGMFKDKVDDGTGAGGDLADLLRQLNEKGSSLAIVQDDPEVVDVVSRTVADPDSAQKPVSSSIQRKPIKSAWKAAK